MSIRLVFLGTPGFSVPTLQALLDADDIEILGVITQPDKPSGRGQKLMPPPVKILAEEAGLTVHQPKSLRKDDAVMTWLKAQEPDFLVTIAFGQILSQDVLDIPAIGTVNVHASLLPEYRGANPIQQAIVDGKLETGLTTMLTDIGVDTGDMLLKTIVPIAEDDTALDLHEMLSQAGGSLLLETLRGLKAGTLKPQPQNHDAATHSPKAKKEDSLLDWEQSAQALHNKIRGQQPWPGASSMIIEQPLKIIESRKTQESDTGCAPGTILGKSECGVLVQTGQGVLALKTVQPAGKKAMPAIDWYNGFKSRVESVDGLVFQKPKEALPTR